MNSITMLKDTKKVADWTDNKKMMKGNNLVEKIED